MGQSYAIGVCLGLLILSCVCCSGGARPVVRGEDERSSGVEFARGDDGLLSGPRREDGTYACPTRGADGLLAGHQRGEGRRRALLVGIGKYQRGRAADLDFWDLHVEQDLRAMAQALCRYRFDEIAVLRNEEATRQGIIDAFRKYLTARSQPGDSAVFHYSGHGQQVPDDNGDEPDGLDESLVPHDYLTRRAADGAKTNLRDDQLGALLGELRQRLRGPNGQMRGNITVVLDSCFSGSATRGDGADGQLAERGVPWEGAPPLIAPGRGSEGQSGLLGASEAAAEGYIVLSATQVNQTAKEYLTPDGQHMGAFTYFLTRALHASAPGNYNEVFERVARDLAAAVPGQDPRLEGGAETEKELFGASVRPYHARVVKVEGNKVLLPLGFLHGVTAGSRYAAYRQGGDPRKPADRLAEVTVTRVRLDMSEARRGETGRGRGEAEALLGAPVVEISHDFSTAQRPLRVLLEGIEELGPALLRESEVVQLTGFSRERWDVRVRRLSRKGTGGPELVVLRKSGSEVARVSGGNGAAARLAQALHGEWRRGILTALRDPRGDTLLQLRILPRRVKANEDGQVERPEDILPGDLRRERTTVGHGLVLHTERPADYWDLELCNRTADLLYVTVFEIDAAGQPEPIYPRPGIRGDRSNQLGAGECRSLGHRYLRRVMPPAGRNLVKAIGTMVPVDLSLLFRPGQARGAARGEEDALVQGLPAPVSPLGRLLLDASAGQRSSAAAAPVELEDWTTGEAGYEVQR